MRGLRKLTLDECSRRAHIPIKYIKRIEAHQWDKLPDPIYARGFITRYCALIKVDAKTLLAQYDEVSNTQSDTDEKVLQKTKPTNSKAVISWIIFLKIGFWLLLMGFPAFHAYTVLIPPGLTLHGFASEIITSDAKFILTGETSRATELYMNNDIQIFLKDDGSFSHSLSLQSGSNMIRLEARNRYGKTRALETSIIYSEDELEIEEK